MQIQPNTSVATAPYVSADLRHLPFRKEMTDTAKVAEPLSGDKLYQQRARSALPLLVMQAISSTPIIYEDLAHELQMPNPMNLNYVLGSIGQTLLNLSQYWGIEIHTSYSMLGCKQKNSVAR